MNIFVLDLDVELAARWHCDKHVVKMPLEHAQMLSTVARSRGIDAGYKPTHKNHPCTKWVSESIDNWRWLVALTSALNTEYRWRYLKRVDHKSWGVVQQLPEPDLPDVGLTPFAQAMPSEYKQTDAVQAYRSYYIGGKGPLLQWRARDKPYWAEESHENDA